MRTAGQDNILVQRTGLNFHWWVKRDSCKSYNYGFGKIPYSLLNLIKHTKYRTYTKQKCCRKKARATNDI